MQDAEADGCGDSQRPDQLTAPFRDLRGRLGYFAEDTFPSGFLTQEINCSGSTLHVRIGGQGAAVVMLHDCGDTGDMWAPAGAALVKHHTVVVPDLRGIGLSTHP